MTCTATPSPLLLKTLGAALLALPMLTAQAQPASSAAQAPAHTASAPAANAATVDISDAWVRGTTAGQSATGAFMKLRANQNMRLVGVTTSFTPVAQIHEMAVVNNVMKMREIPALPLPAGQTVELRPGGYHVMLMDLKQPVQADAQIPLTLVFEDANGHTVKQSLTLPVRALGTPSQGKAKSHPPADHAHSHAAHQ